MVICNNCGNAVDGIGETCSECSEGIVKDFINIPPSQSQISIQRKHTR